MSRPPVDDDSDTVRLYADFLREQDAIEEYQREKARIERERKRDLYAAIREIIGSLGIAPGSGDTVSEWNEAVPKTWKRWGGIPADTVAAGLASAAPWLGIESEDDLYQAFYAITQNARLSSGRFSQD